MTIDCPRVAWSFGIEFGHGGSKALALDLAVPVDMVTPPRPAVIFVHGGGWNTGSREGGHSVIRFLAESGFVAASIDYRLSTEAPFPAQLEDCKAAVRYLRHHAWKYGADSWRIGILGYSAGGHLAALVGLTAVDDGRRSESGPYETASWVSAVAEVGGPTDLEGLLLNPETKGIVMQLLDGETEAIESRTFRHASPLYRARSGAPPFFIAHGVKDDLVSIVQFEEFEGALREHGNDVTLRRIPEYGHVSVDSLPQFISQEIVDFFAAKLAEPLLTGPLPSVRLD